MFMSPLEDQIVEWSHWNPASPFRFIFEFSKVHSILYYRTVYSGVVYKMILKEPVLESSGLCPGQLYCPCYGHNIKNHETPPIFRIDR